MSEPTPTRGPLGLRPRYLVEPDESALARRREILAAMARYSEANVRIPIVWIMELTEINAKP